MTINATLINLYHVCKRECWLHANGINMEHTSDMVYDGKLLHETSYAERNEKHSEMAVEAKYEDVDLRGKIDFYDVIHETKRGNKVESAHEWQVKFYLWLLRLNGIDGANAKIEYPLLRQTHWVQLDAEDISKLEQTAKSVALLRDEPQCPPVIKAKICQSCSYYDLCYIGEE